LTAGDPPSNARWGSRPRCAAHGVRSAKLTDSAHPLIAHPRPRRSSAPPRTDQAAHRPWSSLLDGRSPAVECALEKPDSAHLSSRTCAMSRLAAAQADIGPTIDLLIDLVRLSELPPPPLHKNRPPRLDETLAWLTCWPTTPADGNRRSVDPPCPPSALPIHSSTRAATADPVGPVCRDGPAGPSIGSLVDPPGCGVRLWRSVDMSSGRFDMSSRHPCAAGHPPADRCARVRSFHQPGMSLVERSSQRGRVWEHAGSGPRQ
jgi:hypothetical protein